MSDAEVMLGAILRRLDQIEQAKGVPQYRSVRTLAEAYEVSEDTINRALNRRELRYTQAGDRGAKRIAVSDFLRWLEKHTVPAL